MNPGGPWFHVSEQGARGDGPQVRTWVVASHTAITHSDVALMKKCTKF